MRAACRSIFPGSSRKEVPLLLGCHIRDEEGKLVASKVVFHHHLDMGRRVYDGLDFQSPRGAFAERVLNLRPGGYVSELQDQRRRLSRCEVPQVVASLVVCKRFLLTSSAASAPLAMPAATVEALRSELGWVPQQRPPSPP